MSNDRRFHFRPSVARLEDRTAPALLLAENFDAVAPGFLPAGWGSSSSHGPNWSVANSGFAVPAPSAPNAAYFAGPSVAGSNLLLTPSFVVNGLAPTVAFRLKFDLEFPYDGG